MVSNDHPVNRPFRRDGIIYRLSNLELLVHLEQPSRDDLNHLEHLEHLAFSFISFMFARAASRSLFISLPFSFQFSATQWQGKEQKKEKLTIFRPFFYNFRNHVNVFRNFLRFFLHAVQRKQCITQCKETTPPYKNRNDTAQQAMSSVSLLFRVRLLSNYLSSSAINNLSYN